MTLLERLRETRRLVRMSWWRWWLRHVHWKRFYFAVRLREWPWRVPEGVAIIALHPPPDHVVAYFRRLHGIDPPLAGEDYRRAATDMPEKLAESEDTPNA